VLPFGFEKLRIRRGETQLTSVGDVDAGNQRLDQPLVRLAAQSPRRETGDALVVTGAIDLRGNKRERFGEQPQFAERAEERRLQHGAEILGLHQDEAFGNRQEAPVADDQGATMLFVGRNQLVGKIELAAKIERERRLDQEAVGALLKERIIVSDRKQRAAEPVACFEELQLGVGKELP
jgi:hypothetical protein